jgi:hypothetical protein
MVTPWRAPLISPSWLVQNNDTIMSVVFVVIGSMLFGAGAGQQ